MNIPPGALILSFRCFLFQAAETGEGLEQVHANSGQGTMAADQGVRNGESTGRNLKDYGEAGATKT